MGRQARSTTRRSIAVVTPSVRAANGNGRGGSRARRGSTGGVACETALAAKLVQDTGAFDLLGGGGNSDDDKCRPLGEVPEISSNKPVSRRPRSLSEGPRRSYINNGNGAGTLACGDSDTIDRRTRGRAQIAGDCGQERHDRG